MLLQYGKICLPSTLTVQELYMRLPASVISAFITSILHLPEECEKLYLGLLVISLLP